MLSSMVPGWDLNPRTNLLYRKKLHQEICLFQSSFISLLFLPLSTILTFFRSYGNLFIALNASLHKFSQSHLSVIAENCDAAVFAFQYWNVLSQIRLQSDKTFETGYVSSAKLSSANRASFDRTQIWKFVSFAHDLTLF